MSLSLRADVVVVGAGPAGSAAAFFLARAGVDVLLADRAVFPRDKTCGDGIGVRCLDVFEAMGLAGWLRERGSNVSRSFLLSSPGGRRAVVRGSADLPDVYTIPRSVLDHALVERASAAGARLAEELQILDSRRQTRRGNVGVRLLARRRGEDIILETPLVIAADGGAVALTRQLGLAPRPPEWVAVRAYFEGDAGDPSQLEIHWERAIAPGYAWIFPLGDGRANVGIGAYSRDVHRLGLHLESMLERFVALSPDARSRLAEGRRAGPIHGFPLRADAPDVQPFTAHVLVAGEAAGVVSPLTGEGIGPALRCGRLAAEHALEALERGDFSARSLAAYGHAFHRLFDRPHRAARRLRALITRPFILDRVIARADADAAYGRMLYEILAGAAEPGVALRPGAILKLLRPAHGRPWRGTAAPPRRHRQPVVK